MNVMVIIIEMLFAILTISLVIIVVRPYRENRSKCRSRLKSIDLKKEEPSFYLFSDHNESEKSIKENIVLKSKGIYYLSNTKQRNKDERNILLNEGINVFGRDNVYANYVIPDPHVSKRHFLIDVNGQKMIVSDCNSTNGTYLNGERLLVNPRQLKNGDEIRVCNVVFIVNCD